MTKKERAVKRYVAEGAIITGKFLEGALIHKGGRRISCIRRDALRRMLAKGFLSASTGTTTIIYTLNTAK